MKTSPYSIPPDMSLGAVHLTTAEPARALDFYQNVIGLRLLGRSDNQALLGVEVGHPLVVLTEQPDAKARPARATGLYHFALLLPQRVDLARVLAHLAGVGYPLQGASDHLVSEALYLSDPDGNGIEIYADRGRERWHWQDGQVEMATVPLNVNDLMATLKDDDGAWLGLPDGTEMGHIHLHVAALAEAEAFYRNVLGLDLVLRYGPSAAFLSAGGYHHHVGMNTWAGVGAPSPPDDVIGLRYFTIQLPDRAALKSFGAHVETIGLEATRREDGLLLRDPSNNQLLVTARA